MGLRDGDTLRLFLAADYALTRDGSGVPTGINAQAWTNLDTVLGIVADLDLKIVPVLFFPFPFAGSGGFDRAAMTNSAKATGYQNRTRELCSFLNGYEQVVAIDPINEYGWTLTFTPGGGASYTPQQTAACYENLAAGARQGTSKPLLASCATGHEAVATFAFQDPDSYDVVSLHSYNGAIDFYRPHWGKPVVAGEFGPDTANDPDADAALKPAQTVAVMEALPARVSAAWLWSGFVVTDHSRGLTDRHGSNQPLIDEFVAFTPAADSKMRAWPTGLLVDAPDVDLVDAAPGDLVVVDSVSPLRVTSAPSGRLRPRPRASTRRRPGRPSPTVRWTGSTCPPPSSLTRRSPSTSPTIGSLPSRRSSPWWRRDSEFSGGSSGGRYASVWRQRVPGAGGGFRRGHVAHGVRDRGHPAPAAGHYLDIRGYVRRSGTAVTVASVQPVRDRSHRRPSGFLTERSMTYVDHW